MKAYLKTIHEDKKDKSSRGNTSLKESPSILQEELELENINLVTATPVLGSRLSTRTASC